MSQIATKVTLQDVARTCGLSSSTVSRILNGSKAAGFTAMDDTRRQVEEVAAKLGYRLNHAAKATATGRFGCIAVLMSTFAARSLYSPLLIDGIQDALKDGEMHLAIGSMPDARLEESGFVPRILQNWMADGLLINYNAMIPPRMKQLLLEHHLPSVWVNSKHESNCVYPDDFSAARDLTQKLLELGHKRIAYVNCVTGTRKAAWHYSPHDRYEGYAVAMQGAGLQPRLIAGEEAVDRQKRVEFLRPVLSAPDAPTATICYSPEVAGAVLYTSAVLGLSVPRDLSIATFSVSLFFEVGLEVATAIIPEFQLGQVATEMLLRVIARPQLKARPAVVPFGFERGQTIGPVKEGA